MAERKAAKKVAKAGRAARAAKKASDCKLASEGGVRGPFRARHQGGQHARAPATRSGRRRRRAGLRSPCPPLPARVGHRRRSRPASRTSSRSAAPVSTTCVTSTSTCRAIGSSSSPACPAAASSSLAFDTIYAEGQRRYVESLSSYARQFLGQMDKPDVDFIEGLSPAISIDQKSASRNPRSTVGTITEIYDYLRLLYARIGIPHCPNCGRLITRQTPQQIVDRVLELPEGTRFQVLAPVVRGRKGEYDGLLDELAGQGFTRARIDGEVVELNDRKQERLARYENHTIEVVVDRLVRRPGIERRLTDSLETALRLAEGVAEVEIVRRDTDPPEGQTSPAGHRCEADRRRPRGPHVLRAPRVLPLRAELRRARAPQLLVQLAVRRVRALRRARHAVRGGPGARDRRRRPVDRRRRDRAVERVPRRVLRPGARSGRRGVRLLHRARRGRS